ncbi:tRNA(Glu)-specific nuclease WapA [Pandoraea iniqua]|uniref:RHS repeat-associated core domain-containing protein n=1 Tax=Pandoraea iniqua TaxID=2508288 RepID=UPI00125166D1|nr:RHS repeat-associated core domain-containing protein [Pandoraea iniqua]VVE30873.1 tRNA(Glu)-specific nuclease WapA [Pandoraea iniqua]
MSPIKHFSSNAQLAFETYASMNRHVVVSPKSGQGLLRIPIAGLFADAGTSPALDIGLSCKTHEGDLNILPCGIYTRVRESLADDPYDTFANLPLCDGRTLNFELRSGESFNGGDFLVEGPGYALVVYHKNGVSEKFGTSDLLRQQAGAQKSWIYPTHYILPSGRSLKFDWTLFRGGPRVVAINDDDGRLLNADWIDSPLADIGVKIPAPVLKSITLFPGSDEQVSYACTYANTRYAFEQTIEVTGAVGTAKTIYVLENDQGAIKKFEMRRQQSLPAEKKGDPDVLETSTHAELIDFNDKQIVKHTTLPGETVTALIESYKYDTNKTTIACTQGNKNVLSRVYSFNDTGQVSEAVTAADVTVLTEQSVSIDKARGTATHKTIKKIANVVVDELALEYDASGNLIKSTQGDTITEWTYFNNYAAYTVKENATSYHDTSFFGILLKVVDFTNPIGLGFVAFGSGGLTWGTRIDSTVTMSITNNDYAKATFQLPFDMSYAGDTKSFTSHVESELVYRQEGGKNYALRLTYYGYASLTCKPVSGVDREYVLLPGRKLTVMHPSYEEIDVSAEQLKIAKAAAKALLDSLDKQLSTAADKKSKDQTQSLIDTLNKSLVQQSKTNARGFKLKQPSAGKWTERSMHLEDIAYQTSVNDPGFGQISTTSAWRIGAGGGKVRGSEIKTSFTYKTDAKNKRKITVLTTTETADATTFTLSQTRSALTGRIDESVDGEGVKTTCSYDKVGTLIKETASQAGVTAGQREYTITPLKGRRWQHETLDTVSKQRTRVIRDELARDCESWASPDGKVWLLMTRCTYDAQGRLASDEQYDYDYANVKHSMLTTNWTYDDAKNTCSVKKVQTDAGGKEVDTQSLTLASKAMGETLLVGAAETQRNYDAAERTLTESAGASGAPSFRKLTTFDAGGNMTSVNTETIDGSRTTLPGDKITMAYDGQGRLKTLTPAKGAPTAFTYDRFDRLLTSTTDGIEISNIFPDETLASVAVTAYVEDDKGTISLGEQRVDGLGRPAREISNGTDAIFTYNGASRWGKQIDAGERPATVTGYKSEIDASGLRYTETMTDNAGTRASKTHFSHRQQIIAFEDITGAKTAFQYDAFGRLERSINDSCEATYVYSDNGLLSKETIKAAKQNLTMTVQYSYNRSGIEIKRKFECTGVKTHVIESQRIGDGRIDRIMLKVDDKTSNADYFEYDASQRLKTWSCSQAGFAGYGGKQYVKQVFDYDKLGNVLSSDNEFYTGTSRPEALSVSTTTRTYDAKPGVLTTLDGKPYDNDDAGRLTKRSNRTLAYYGNGRAKSCSATAGGKDGDFVFTYDDLGRIRGGSAGKGKWNETYHYRGQRRYAVCQQDDAKKHGFNKRTLVLKNDSPSCFLQEASTTIDDKTTATSSFELRDQAGTVFASIDLDTKAITYYRYSPYGYRNVDPGVVTWLGFKGEPLNYVGFYHLGNGYRMYDPEHCRFQSPDVMSPFGIGGIAAYVYCHGDPINYHDPSGHVEIAQYSRLDTMPLMYTQEFRIAASVLGLLATPFTSGSSLALAIGVTGLAAVGSAFDISSIVLEESDPELASVLGYLGLGFGVINLGTGVLGTARRAPAVVAGQGLRGGGLYSRMVARFGRVKPGLAGNATKKVGLQGNKGFKALTKGNSYAGVVNGAYGATPYGDAAAKVSNYLSTEYSTAAYAKEMQGLANTKSLDIGGLFGNLDRQHGVDLLLPMQQITFDQVMDALAGAGYHYKVVDGLFCRSATSAMAPGFAKPGLSRIFDGMDWWSGARTTL